MQRNFPAFRVEIFDIKISLKPIPTLKIVQVIVFQINLNISIGNRKQTQPNIPECNVCLEMCCFIFFIFEIWKPDNFVNAKYKM